VLSLEANKHLKAVCFFITGCFFLPSIALADIFSGGQINGQPSINSWKALRDFRIVKQELDYSCGAASRCPTSQNPRCPAIFRTRPINQTKHKENHTSITLSAGFRRCPPVIGPRADYKRDRDQPPFHANFAGFHRLTGFSWARKVLLSAGSRIDVACVASKEKKYHVLGQCPSF
jgi:hypothetical protein